MGVVMHGRKHEEREPGVSHAIHALGCQMMSAGDNKLHSLACRYKMEEVFTTTAIKLATASLGFNDLKPLQEEAIRAYVNGRNVLVVFPTGFGKRICYGCLSYVFDILGATNNTSIAIIVSPLVSLMVDRVSKFNRMGISSGMITSGMSFENLKKVEKGEFQLLFISPEALLATRMWRALLIEEPYKTNVVAFAVDCVKQW